MTTRAALNQPLRDWLGRLMQALPPSNVDEVLAAA